MYSYISIDETYIMKGEVNLSHMDTDIFRIYQTHG